jgi:hypothetical protein
MRQSTGSLIEVAALIVIAIFLAAAGRTLLAELHAFETAGILLIGAAIVAASLSLRNLGREASSLERSRRAAYLTALALALWAVIAPARWNFGATIVMLEIAIGFDILSRLTKPSEVGPGGS